MESKLESELESTPGPQRPIAGNVYSFTMSFKIFDQDAFDLALEDLHNEGVWGLEEVPADNTIEENLEILVKHLDVLAYYRELPNIAFMDIGIEQVTG